MNKVFSLIAVLFVLSSCTAVKEYEKEYINDPEMKLSAKTAELAIAMASGNEIAGGPNSRSLAVRPKTN